MLEKKQRTRAVGMGMGVGWKRDHPVGWGKVSQKAVPSVVPAFSTFLDKGGA